MTACGISNDTAQSVLMTLTRQKFLRFHFAAKLTPEPRIGNKGFAETRIPDAGRKLRTELQMH
jgi:hypothetical protein